MKPGEFLLKKDDIIINENSISLKIEVSNIGDRPIQVGSHYHFYEVNPALKFDRIKARGFRLNIASGTAVRFEPGQIREIKLVSLGGERNVFGFRGEIMGSLKEVEND